MEPAGQQCEVEKSLSLHSLTQVQFLCTTIAGLQKFKELKSYGPAQLLIFKNRKTRMGV